MVPIALQPTIETELTAIASGLAIMQPAFFSAYGRYWQGLRTHAVPPADAIATAPNRNLRPTDQLESWTDMGIALPALASAAYTVHAYETRAGHGYVIPRRCHYLRRLSPQIPQHRARHLAHPNLAHLQNHPDVMTTLAHNLTRHLHRTTNDPRVLQSGDATLFLLAANSWRTAANSIRSAASSVANSFNRSSPQAVPLRR
jgi:hypothetical protein